MKDGMFYYTWLHWILTTCSRNEHLKILPVAFFSRFLSYKYDLFIFWNIILVFHSIWLSSLIEIPRWNECPVWLKIICLSLKLLEACWRAHCRETLQMALIWGQPCQSTCAGQGEKLPQTVCSSYLMLLEATSAVVLFQCSQWGTAVSFAGEIIAVFSHSHWFQLWWCLFYSLWTLMKCVCLYLYCVCTYINVKGIIIPKSVLSSRVKKFTVLGYAKCFSWTSLRALCYWNSF